MKTWPTVEPIVGGPDRQAREQAAHDSGAAHYQRAEAAISAALAQKHAQLDEHARAHSDEWGATDGDRRRIDNRLHYENIVVPAYQLKRTAILNAITELEAQKVQLLREKAAYARRVGAAIIDGPAIAVTSIEVPDIHTDERLRQLHASRDAAVSTREALYPERDALYGIVTEADRAYALVVDKVKFDLATKADLTAARKAATEAQARHQRAITSIAELTTEIDRIELSIAERTEHLERERAHAIGRAVEDAAFAAADALVVAMQHQTRLRRAIAEYGIGSWWSLRTMNLDDPRSAGRAFLQQAMEAGWVPKESAQ